MGLPRTGNVNAHPFLFVWVTGSADQGNHVESMCLSFQKVLTRGLAGLSGMAEIKAGE